MSWSLRIVLFFIVMPQQERITNEWERDLVDAVFVKGQKTWIDIFRKLRSKDSMFHAKSSKKSKEDDY